MFDLERGVIVRGGQAASGSRGRVAGEPAVFVAGPGAAACLQNRLLLPCQEQVFPQGGLRQCLLVSEEKNNVIQQRFCSVSSLLDFSRSGTVCWPGGESFQPRLPGEKQGERDG